MAPFTGASSQASQADAGGAVQTIQIPREQASALRDFADRIRAGELRRPETARAALDDMAAFDSEHSYFGRSGRRARNFITPAAAAKMLSDGEDPQFVFSMLGPKGIEEANRIQQFVSGPTESELHVDQALTEISIGYQNEDFIAAEVFPRVQVTKPSDYYTIFDAATWRRDEGVDLVRGLSAQAARGGYTVSRGVYLTERYTFEHMLDDAQRDAADDQYDLDAQGTELCTAKIDLRLEKLVSTLLFTLTNWHASSAALSGNDLWSDYTNSDPFAKWKTARLAVGQSTGRRPNTAVMGVEVYETLALHTKMIDRIKYTGTQANPSMVTPMMLASLIGVERLLVGRAVENVAKEQLPDVESLSFMWGKKFWIGYVSPAPARQAPSAGYTFTKGRKADRYREENRTSDIIRCEEEFDVRVTARDAGLLYDTVIA